jgi:hypothetical protein
MDSIEQDAVFEEETTAVIITKQLSLSFLRTIPMFGDLLNTIYQGIPDELKQRRFERFVSELADKVNELDTKVGYLDQNFNRSKNFMESILDEVSQSKSELKREYYLAAFVNLPRFTNQLSEQVLARLVDALVQLDIIDFVQLELLLPSITNFRKAELTDEVSENALLLNGSHRRLERFGLIEIKMTSVPLHNQPIKEQYKSTITDLGEVFLKFILPVDGDVQ